MKLRKNILTIGGFDPCAGAGILADIKTFELHKCYGHAVNTSTTVQNESTFVSVNWVEEDLIFNQVIVLISKYDFDVVKIGLIPNFDLILELIFLFKEEVKIVWDPILSASAGFDFNQDLSSLNSVLKKVFLLTPNMDEVKKITGLEDGDLAAKMLSKYCSVLLKGGHNEKEVGVDYLYEKSGNIIKLEPSEEIPFSKHGSGCILSSAISSNLLQELELKEACVQAKIYTENVLRSNNTLLGYHYEN